MSRPARFECESCHRLLGEVERGQIRIARSVELVYAVPGGLLLSCPGCEAPRLWRDEPVAQGVATNT